MVNYSFMPPKKLIFLTRSGHACKYIVSSFQEFEIIERSGQGTLDTTLTGRGFVRLPAESSYELEVVVPETFDYNVVVRYEVRCLKYTEQIYYLPFTKVIFCHFYDTTWTRFLTEKTKFTGKPLPTYASSWELENLNQWNICQTNSLKVYLYHSPCS